MLTMTIAGALWRLWDGSNSRKPMTAVRNLICFMLAFIAASGTGAWAFWLAGIATLGLVVGRTDWESYGAMVPRYLIPTAVAGLPYAAWALLVDGGGNPVGGLLYAALGLIPGLAYPTLMALKKVPTVWWLDGPEAYARAIAGGVLIGGLALI